jgi:signal transduction histidine kinase/HAMP domain-containing protein
MTRNTDQLRTPIRMTSLRTKFIVFISVIIVAVCSGLSWYVVNQQAQFMAQSLRNTGLRIINNLAYNSRFPLIAKDTLSLERLSDGAMKVEEVVYVVMTDSKGMPLVSKSKGALQNGRQARMAEAPLYPDGHIVQSLLAGSHLEPVITPFKSQSQLTTSSTPWWNFQFTGQTELLYDFAVPVHRRAASDMLLGTLALEEQEDMRDSELLAQPQSTIHGIVQVGVSNEMMIQQLNDIVWNIMLITFLIIALGIVATTFLANRIINPLRSLAEVAKKVSAGDFSVSLVPSTHDEVGELSMTFNTMTKAIRDREQAISAQVATITKHANKLTTLNQTASAIASHLDLNALLSTVLHLLVEKVGFTHMLLMLYDPDRGIVHQAQTAGIPDELGSHIRSLEIPIHEDGSLHADLLFRGEAFLIPEIQMVRGRLDPQIFPYIMQLGVTSFVCAPLKSQQSILGFIAADSTPEICTQEDLDLLITIANTVGSAIDNAKAYQQLGQLNITLEQRVDERTQKLTEANVKLQELDQLKSAFVSIVSHELRTPMTSVKGLVENMLDGLTGELTDRQTFYLTRVRANVDRLTRMINDLLDISRIEAGRMDLIPVSLFMPELIKEVIENLQGLAAERGVSLTMVPAQGVPQIRGDRDKIGQVLTNLVHNAIKFTPPAGNVSISVGKKGDQFVEVCVSDTGCGIPHADLQTIFERFYRSPLGPHESRGAGLGLAITKNLVDLHGGQIWAESTEEKGSKFFFTLPVAGPRQ